MVHDVVSWHSQPTAVFQHGIAEWVMFSKQHPAPIAPATAGSNNFDMFGLCRLNSAQHVNSTRLCRLCLAWHSLRTVGIDYARLALVVQVLELAHL